jgi:hypothetical protein
VLNGLAILELFSLNCYVLGERLKRDDGLELFSLNGVLEREIEEG